MADNQEHFPRKVFDELGCYNVRKAASYLVDDPRLRELAAIGYARRDLQKAHEFISACSTHDKDDRQILEEEALWASAIVFYSKPFGRNNARKDFGANQFVEDRLDADGLKMHRFLRRCRDKWIAHDDGMGESKTMAIYLPPSPPRSFLEIGLHSPARRVVSLGTDIARRLEPHFATVHGLIKDHEDASRDLLGTTLVKTHFADVRLIGFADETSLVEEFYALLPPIPALDRDPT